MSVSGTVINVQSVIDLVALSAAYQRELEKQPRRLRLGNHLNSAANYGFSIVSGDGFSYDFDEPVGHC